MRDFGRLRIDREQKERWKGGGLAEEWAKRFPFLFDADDLRLAISQGPGGYHFVEWLGAIVLHHATGFHALVAKYEFKKHRRKQRVLRQLLPAEVISIIDDKERAAQCPDLLMFAPSRSDWFFCEIKGPGDRLSPQQRGLFSRLAEVGGRPVGLLRFAYL